MSSAVTTGAGASSAVEATKDETRSGADAIVQTLQRSGVEFVFGYSGGGTMFLINSIVSHNLANMSAKTELGAAWMAYGYNRIKRRAASACLFHCVGTLHASPVIYASKLDSTPFVLMDVNLSNSLDMREALQEGTDLYSAVKPLTKYSRKIVTAEDLPLAVRQAVLSANTGRFGPSFLDLAFQVLQQKTTCITEPLQIPHLPAAAPAAVKSSLELIRKARNPVIIVGAGVHLSNATAELKEFAELSGIPVISTSWGGRGALPDDHPLFGGVMGAFGWVSANDIAQRADLWIALGTTFSQMTTGAWSVERPQDIIHVDIDPNQLGKIMQPTVGVVGDLATVLGQFTDALKGSGWQQPDWHKSDWVQYMHEQKRKWLELFHNLGATSSTPINQYYLINRLNALLPKGTLVVADSGGHAFMMYRSFEYHEVTQMVSGSRYMSMGASLPMAIGAKLAAPERVVVSYHGDGGFYYDLNELATLTQHNIKVIIILDNNHCLLANRSGMKMMGFDNPWADLPASTDFVKVAQGFGVAGEQVTEPGQIDGAINRALAAEGSYLIDVTTDPDTRVRRAIKNVVPILSDRPPSPGSEKHIDPPLKGSWPNRWK